ncbi:glycine--tRNA ligase subunit beta [Zavarzinia compransoris]|uniref:Glycine--tRNA ligase beta subunit n=1 Tax=Zavarzinia compransoris TaxID=1264899 RepID=A0A317E5T7_9PROT|nr:glycine--tRNA ligase subunit beta [Zavarzinia compransoris]PWR20723.1 glycine--tRNA ligase subunit beta [Zavarzinia compransoris]TDP44449.1 glycyl-tRNA synthetase beta chain [Zavarzinia compransoris]
MPQLLIEIHSEEIPARMQPRAADDLQRLILDGFKAVGLKHGTAKAYATPRRLTLVVDDLDAAQADLREERRGPRVGAPDQAIDGFCTAAGVSRETLQVQETPKGNFYIAHIERRGRPTAEVIAELMANTLWNFPWPKSMRWGAGPDGVSSKLNWVRPIRSVIVLFGGQVVPFAIARGEDAGHGITAGNLTHGHRFMARGAIEVADFADYRAKLRAAHVILDVEERKAIIWAGAQKLAADAGLEVTPDPDLLDEVAGLVEWPVPLMGRIDDEFMAVPAEVLTSTMRANQKYFALRDPATGRMAPRFLTVANLVAKDGGASIAAGNERVLRARLSDAKFFWDQDLKTTLADRVPALDAIVFHAKLGTVGAKVARVRALAARIAGTIGADAALADRAALLAKADLVSGVVGEFPEVQGIMGRYYARKDGEDAAVADAIAEHWKPQGPSDQCPSAPVSVAVALADKIDTLAGFFAIDEKPTGSKDPFALRRAALGVIRLIVENGLRLPLKPLFGATADSLLEFFHDRLKVSLKDQGVAHDLINAVLGTGAPESGGEDDLTRLVRKVAALKSFLETEDGKNMLAAYRRASNILRIEEKKDGKSYAGPADRAQFAADEESALGARLDAAMPKARAALAQEDFAACMQALALLREPVDAFFEKVTVNADDPALRANRLKLLAEIRGALDEIADFSRIEG